MLRSGAPGHAGSVVKGQAAYRLESATLGRMPAEGVLRRALIERIETRWENTPETLVVEEFGTHFGQSRIDVAVVNGALWGYEIKSADDRLDRLPAQCEAYGSVFDFLTAVLAEKHVDRAERVVPHWWGIISARSTKTGRTVLTERKRPRQNREVSAETVASLLWRDELLSILAEQGLAKGWTSATRAALAAGVAQALPLPELRSTVRSTLRARQEWRADPAHTQYAETPPLASTSSGFLARRLRQQRRLSTHPQR